MIASQIWLTWAPASERPRMQPSPTSSSRIATGSSLAKVIGESGRELVVERELAHRRERSAECTLRDRGDGLPDELRVRDRLGNREHVPAQRDRGRGQVAFGARSPGMVGVQLAPSVGRRREHLAERGHRRERSRVPQRHQLA